MYQRPRLLTSLLLAATCALTGCSGSSGGDDDPGVQPDTEAPADGNVQISVDDVEAGEADGTVTFSIRASGAALDGVTVRFATADGTATAGEDYEAASGTVTFADGAPEQTVVVTLIDDAAAEGTETFRLELADPVNAELRRAAATATIIDDDDLEVCGEPTVDPARDAGAYLWKDCQAGTWHLGFTGGGERARYDGLVDASEPFVQVTPMDLEDDDLVATPQPDRLSFAIDVTRDLDRVDLQVRSDEGTCLDLLLPANGPVHLGPDAVAVDTPLDLGSLAACDRPAPAAWNVVVLFTDDQRFDTLQHMPELSARLMPRGVNFEQAYVPTPLCCPARASTYAGGLLAQNTGVLTNSGVNGGMQAFDDSNTLGTRLQGAGYRTQFVGKWLNDYIKFAPYVPPGWDFFAGRAEWETQADWFDFRYGSGSTGESSIEGREIRSAGQYHVNFERDLIVDFIGKTPPDQPFFVFWATTPPHAPFTPDDQDADAFSDFTYRDRGYGESDLSDKPSYVQGDGGDMTSGDDEDVRNQLRSMLSVDRGLDDIVDAIAAQGRLHETVFIFTSDNGYMWGEHGLWAKNKPYEESIRVPMLIAMPGIAPRADDNLVYTVLDLGPTVYELAGTEGPSDGTSLLPLLRDPQLPWRNELFFEKYSTARSMHGLWMGLRRDDWKYVEYANGEAELYDLANDPYELDNLANAPEHADRRNDLASRLQEQLGIAIKPVLGDPSGQVGEPYLLALEAWGGEPPLTWQIESGELPPGLRLDEASGEISGTPAEAGSWTFRVRVTGTDMVTLTETPETWVTGEILVEVR